MSPNLYAADGGAIEGLDHAFLNQGIHLDVNAARPSRTGMFDFVVDESLEGVVEIEGSDEQLMHIREL